MDCPNCGNFMEGISMSGNETEIKHEFYCYHCHTYLMYSYNPEVTYKKLSEFGIISENIEKTLDENIDNGLPF